MKQSTGTRMFKLYNSSIEIEKTQKPIRMCSRKVAIVGEKVFSYDTEVATIDWTSQILYVPQRSFFYSRNTTCHIRKVVKKLNLTLFANKPQRPISKGEYTHSFTW